MAGLAGTMTQHTRKINLDPFPQANKKLCPKCGRWVEQPQYHMGKVVHRYGHGGVKVECCIDQEHMHWDCACGHRMVTATLDAPAGRCTFCGCGLQECKPNVFVCPSQHCPGYDIKARMFG